jgi:lysophospholipase L1-like esterase
MGGADDPERAALEQQVTDELRAKYAAPDSGVIVVDVNTAFRQAGDLTALLKPDGAHPSEQGAQLWADTVIQALKLN